MRSRSPTRWSHRKGVVHRDLKACDITRTKSGTKLFGGVVTSVVLVFGVYPVIYYILRLELQDASAL